MATTNSDRQLLTVLLLVLAALVLLPVLFMGFGMMGWGSMMGGMWGDGMWRSGSLPGWTVALYAGMQLLFLAAVLGGGYLVVRAVTRGRSDSDGAMEALRTAYARGDLSDEEYERRRETLERDR